MRLPNWLWEPIFRWAWAYRQRWEPDFIIGGADDPYLKRWWVIPRNPLFNIYLHEFHRSDDDRALHDHPWVNCSLVLENGYDEVMPSGKVWRGAGTVTVRWPSASHRVELREYLGHPVVAATLFITGPRVREWGFWCPQGWVHWRKFTDPATAGTTVGRGCDQ